MNSSANPALQGQHEPYPSGKALFLATVGWPDGSLKTFGAFAFEYLASKHRAALHYLDEDGDPQTTYCDDIGARIEICTLSGKSLGVITIRDPAQAQPR